MNFISHYYHTYVAPQLKDPCALLYQLQGSILVHCCASHKAPSIQQLLEAEGVPVLPVAIRKFLAMYTKTQIRVTPNI